MKRARAAVGGGSLLWLLACGGAERDVVPESRDVRVTGGARADEGSSYEYVARRPLAVVALAEGRGIAPEVARAAIDRLADSLDACVTDQGRSGRLAEGAARVVAPVADDGSVGAPAVRIDPASNGAASAVLCLVAPLRLLTFPPADAGARGIAVEALWGRLERSP